MFFLKLILNIMIVGDDFIKSFFYFFEYLIIIPETKDSFN